MRDGGEHGNGTHTVLGKTAAIKGKGCLCVCGVCVCVCVLRCRRGGCGGRDGDIVLFLFLTHTVTLCVCLFCVVVCVGLQGSSGWVFFFFLLLGFVGLVGVRAKVAKVGCQGSLVQRMWVWDREVLCSRCAKRAGQWSQGCCEGVGVHGLQVGCRR